MAFLCGDLLGKLKLSRLRTDCASIAIKMATPITAATISWVFRQNEDRRCRPRTVFEDRSLASATTGTAEPPKEDGRTSNERASIASSPNVDVLGVLEGEGRRLGETSPDCAKGACTLYCKGVARCAKSFSI